MADEYISREKAFEVLTVYYHASPLPSVNYCFRLVGGDGRPVGFVWEEDDFCSRGERKT